MAIQVPTELLDGSVLAFLENEDLYGYALTQKVQSFFNISESTIYPVLRRLKKDKCLETYDQPYQGRNRRYYKLTDSGLKKLTAIRADWQDFSQKMDQVLKEDKHE